MKYLKKFNEEVRSDYRDHQQDDGAFGDDLDRLVWFVRDNEDDILELIEFWETSHGREFNESEYQKWFNDNMLYEQEVNDDLNEGVADKAVRRKDKKLDINPEKKDNFRKKIKDHVKSQRCDVKQVGNDFEIHCGDDHIAQVMFRDDYVGVKKQGNKFPKELGYNELGKIKSELTDIIKSI